MVGVPPFRAALNVDFYRVALDSVIPPSLRGDDIDFCRARLEHGHPFRAALNVDFYRVALDSVIPPSPRADDIDFYGSGSTTRNVSIARQPDWLRRTATNGSSPNRRL